MATQAEAQMTSSSSMEGEDVFMDDQRGDGKKKKFKPFQKVRNFFRGGSKKRKVDEGDGMPYSHSTGALHHNIAATEDDDEGGFRRKGLGSRSISEDSIFQPEPKEPSIGVLKGQAVSMEAINTGFQAELFSKLKARQSDSDLDEGLPYSPASLVSPTSHMFRSRTQSEPVPVKQTQDSQQSLVSMDGSDEDLFSSNWKSGVASVKPRSSSGGDLDKQMDIADFEEVQVRSTHLSNEAAKHRISVKPKSRRLSSKMSMKRKEKPVTPVLTEVKEEPPSPAKVQESKLAKPSTEESVTKPVSAAQQKTVISTTIPVGMSPKPGSTVIPARSEPRDIPQPRRRTDESELNKARSLSPISTSPVSKAALEDVKLKARPLSGKFEGVELRREPMQTENELSKAFNRAKRFSRKYDGDGNIVDSSGVVTKQKDTEVKKDIDNVKAASAAKEDIKVPVVAATKTSTALSQTTSQMSQSVSSKPQSTTSPVSPGVTGVSFVLKKEPLRPGSKTPDKTVNAAESQSFASADPLAKETKDSDPVKKDINEVIPDISATAGKKGSEEKLASPREDYRLKRQNRSKTLPVSKEMMDKADELEGTQKPASRTGSPPLKSMSRSEYDNVTVSAKPLQSKRSSWAPASAAGSASTEPPWMVRNRLKNLQQDNQNKEVKVDIKKDVKAELKSNTPANEKASDKPEKGVKVTEKPPVTSNIKSIIEKNSSGSMTRSWAPTQSTKLFDKPSVQPSTKPADKGPGEKTDTAKVTIASTTKPTTTSQSVAVKPSVTVSAKPTVTVSSVKPTVSSAKTVSSVSSDKPPQGIKPTVSSVNKPVADKPLSQSMKTNALDSKFSQFGGKVGSQKPLGGTVQPLSQSVKTTTQSAGRPTMGTSANVAKTDTKEPVKPAFSSDTKKNFSQDNKKQETDTKREPVSKPVTAFDKPKPVKADTGSNVPAWKQALNQRKNNNPITQQVKIEIIDKEPEKAPEKRVEQKPAVEMREKAKAAPDKCSDGNRSSKVLDMVRSFQNLQVT